MSNLSKKAAAAAGILAFLATSGIAFAQDAVTTTTAVTAAPPTPTAVIAPAPMPAPTMSTNAEPTVLDIGADGKVLLRGTIASVSANSLTVKSWGGDWTVNVAASTSVLPAASSLSSFQTGDFVGVQGMADGSASWTVDASLVRDWTVRAALTQQIKTNTQAVQQMRASEPKTIQGTLSNFSATSPTFTVTGPEGTAYSVTLGASPLLLTTSRATLNLSQVNNGDTVRVYGPVASSTITASIFRDISVK